MSGIERLQARAGMRKAKVAPRFLVVLALLGFLALGVALELVGPDEALWIDGQRPPTNSAQ